jgi:Fe-S cluster assembly ATP-binding protein
MLKIENLKASIEGVELLKGVNLSVNSGEVHAIMGPNGSGKSTLASVIAGQECYEVVGGSILFEGENLLDLDPDLRAHRGVFLSFQYPVEIPGISVSNFIKTAITEKRKVMGLGPISAKDLLSQMREKMELLNIKTGYLSRNMNEGFSGGEKKRNEIFQMAMLKPKLAILDETDSGLDIDALQIVARGVNKLKTKHNATIIITHYQRLLDYIIPDFVHVLHNGRIIKSGGKELAHELEKSGYERITKEAEKEWGF